MSGVTAAISACGNSSEAAGPVTQEAVPAVEAVVTQTPTKASNEATEAPTLVETVATEPTQALEGTTESVTAPPANTKLNLNEATGEDFQAAIPNFGNRMVREFLEYQPVLKSTDALGGPRRIGWI